MSKKKQVLCLSLGLLLFGACQSAKTVSLPKGIPVVTRAQWGAMNPLLPMKTHVPQKITIHHTATKQNASRTVQEKLKSLQKFSMERSPLSDGRIKEPWADVPYHFYIAVDGTIGEGRQLQYVGDSNTPYDPTGHVLIVLEGNFQNEKVSEAQLQSLKSLSLAVAKRWKISGDNISGHKDNATTACPGEDLYQLLPQLREMINRGSI
ncbi:peptidoglycan recognition protein family protein [Sabulibacter ruber]|uniref:peptidoglycan recognition protein family protein n=1 Tax=Sabulibacter ruber TaxID=2811901 RepID=UPI001F614EDE|nr:peptidoglycan recognition family protein [Sabulibacter ruber]